MAKKTVKAVKAVKVEKKDESKKEKALFDEEIRYIIAKIKRSKSTEVCHYSYLLKSTLKTLEGLGIKVRYIGQHSYGFTIPSKKSGTWRKMSLYGKPRDEKGHFIKG